MSEPVPVNPFVEYRHHLDTYAHALAAGWSDDRWCREVLDLDARVAEVDGTGFTVTPLIALDTPLERPVWGKVETGSVAGSHKARHLFALALSLRIDEVPLDTELAIASCGNAALAAATIAAAADRALRVFVPTDADVWILGELDRLGARVEPCPRDPARLGDPCMHGLEGALTGGAIPFTVQGPICPGSIDGARTLGLELAEQLTEVGVTEGDLYIQVGGGALGTAVADGLARADEAPRMRLNPVQASAVAPFPAAWDRLLTIVRATSTCQGVDAAMLEALMDANPGLMEPWPTTPHSVATGILDDVTYDWATLMRHQIRTGGHPVRVEEATFVEAVDLCAGQIEPPPDATGAAGLAGLLTDDRSETHHPPSEPRTAVVLLTGRRRPNGTP